MRGKLDGPLLHMLNELRKEVSGQSLILQAPVVRKMDSAHYPSDKLLFSEHLLGKPIALSEG